MVARGPGTMTGPMSAGGKAVRKRSLALLIVIATLALGAAVAQLAPAKGGGQIGEAWGTPGTGNGQLFNPVMFGADSTDGTIYAGDYTGTVSTESSNFRIQQLSASGEFKASAEIKRFPTAKRIIALDGIAVDPSLGPIYTLCSSTPPEGGNLVPEKTTPTIALPEGAEELYTPKAIAVDPSSHDILLL